MVALKTLFVAASAISSVAAFGKRAESNFALYAYGKGIGGQKLYYAGGKAYIGSEAAMEAYVNVTFATTAQSLVQTGTVTISSASSENGTVSTLSNNTNTDVASASGSLLSVNTASNSPVSFSQVSTLSTSSDTKSSDFTFFGAILTLKSGASPTASFYAVPVADDVHQIFWFADKASASTLDIPVTVKSHAPASSSGAQSASAAKKRR